MLLRPPRSTRPCTLFPYQSLCRSVVRPDQSSLGKAVQAERANAAALTALSIADMASKNEGVESTDPFGEVAGESVKGHGGFAFRPEDKELYDAFNAELKKFIGSPEHIALVTQNGSGGGQSGERGEGKGCDST